MALLSTLLDRVHDEFPAVPEVMALRALSDSVKEFCSRTHIWQDELSRINLRVGDVTYDLYPDDGLVIAALKEVRLDGKRIDPVATTRFQRLPTTLSEGTPTGYVQIRPDAIVLDRAPVEVDRLTVKAALTLSQGETEADIPDVILDEYAEALAAGAKMRLVKQASQPWFAPDAAVNYSVPYYTAVNTAKMRVMTALGEADLQVEMRGWA